MQLESTFSIDLPTGGIKTVIFRQLLVERGMLLFKLFRFLKKALRGHGEELRWIGRTVWIHHGRASGIEILAELLESLLPITTSATCGEGLFV